MGDCDVAVKTMQAEAQGKTKNTAERQFTPALDYILVEDGLEEKHGELFIPPGARRDGHIWCEVLDVGPGRPSERTGDLILYPLRTVLDDDDYSPAACVPGEEVLVSVGSWTRVEIDGAFYCFVRPGDIVARR